MKSPPATVFVQLIMTGLTERISPPFGEPTWAQGWSRGVAEAPRSQVTVRFRMSARTAGLSEQGVIPVGFSIPENSNMKETTLDALPFQVQAPGSRVPLVAEEPQRAAMSSGNALPPKSRQTSSVGVPPAELPSISSPGPPS